MFPDLSTFKKLGYETTFPGLSTFREHGYETMFPGFALIPGYKIHKNIR